jgi:hypothetical protein
MSGFDQKALLASPWERTSAKGNTYWSGFLGKARVIGFRGEPHPDGTQTWDLYLTPGKGAGGSCRQPSATGAATAIGQRLSASAWPGPATPAATGGEAGGGSAVLRRRHL